MSFLLELDSLSKSYGGKKACDGVDLRLSEGLIHGLIGENGAGKSTLVKMIGGLVRADSGSIFWQGEEVRLSSPSHARGLGIGMVFQHFSLFDALSVSENVELGLGKGKFGDNISDVIRRVSEEYGLGVEPSRAVSGLGVGERQRVEIVRCLLQEPRLLIMDEPTSVLTPQEADKLMEILKRLSEEGRVILYISHRLSEVEELCDSATVMRHGRVVREVIPKNETAMTIATAMMGESFEGNRRRNVLEVDDREEVLLMRGVSCDKRPYYEVPLRNVSLDLRRGEILGIAGLAGNGQDLFGSILSGEELLDGEGEIQFFGEEVSSKGVLGRKKMGFGYVPEDRNGHGALPSLSLLENGLLGSDFFGGLWKRNFLGDWLDYDKANDFAEDIVRGFDVRCQGVGHSASSLSGGNLQKFILGRELKQRPKLLLAMQPTWGLDVGAASLIHSFLINLAKSGCGIILVSQELDELMMFTNRIGVFSEGYLSKLYRTDSIGVEEIGLLMSGGG